MLLWFPFFLVGEAALRIQAFVHAPHISLRRRKAAYKQTCKCYCRLALLIHAKKSLACARDEGSPRYHPISCLRQALNTLNARPRPILLFCICGRI